MFAAISRGGGSWREGDCRRVEIVIVVVNCRSVPWLRCTNVGAEYRWSLTVRFSHWQRPRRRGKVTAHGADAHTRATRILYGGLALTFATLRDSDSFATGNGSRSWVVEGAVLVWSGLRAKFQIMRWAGFFAVRDRGGKTCRISIPRIRSS